MPQKNAAAMQREALLNALASQQRIIEAQERNIAMIARYAGLTDQLVSTADINNPAAPVADPASEGAFQSTEDALESAGHDNVENLGSTPGVNDGVAAEKTTTPMAVGTEIPTQPFNDLQDVTAPVSGTETHVPGEQTRIETDVRVGNPDNPEVAFPWMGGDKGAADVDVTKRSSRTFQAIKLARLRMNAGVESGEELEIAGRIEADASLSDSTIEHEINVLSAIKSNARQAPRHLVPRAASATKANPSFQQPTLGQFSAAVTPGETEDADLFD